MAKNPVFPLYYNDMDRSTRDWTDEEFGAYMRLLVHQWDKFGLPLGFDRLSRIAPSVEKNWPLLSTKFKLVEGTYQNENLEVIRDESLSFKKKQKENGKKGGRPPGKNKPKNNPDINPTGNPDINPKKSLHTEVEVEEEIEDNKKGTGIGKRHMDPVNTPLAFRMKEVYAEVIPTYTFRDADDLPPLRLIAEFIFDTAGVANGFYNLDEQEICLNTFRLVAQEVKKDPFWVNKPLKTIQKSVQEFYNKIKNPQQNGKQKQATGGDINLQSAFSKIDLLTGEAGNTH